MGAAVMLGLDRTVLVGGSMVGAALLTGCVVLAADEPPLLFLRLALVALAATSAFVLDDPAAPAVGAVPRTRRRRTADRATGLALPLLVWAGGITALEVRVPATPALGLLAEGAGGVAVAVAVAAVLRWAGRNEPGEVAASVVGGTMLALLANELPPRWPVQAFPWTSGWVASSALWGGLTAAAGVLVVLASADPYRPRTRLSRR